MSDRTATDVQPLGGPKLGKRAQREDQEPSALGASGQALSVVADIGSCGRPV